MSARITDAIKAVKNPPKKVQQATSEVAEIAKAADSHAYRFVRLRDKSLLEVRCWPDGSHAYTPVDNYGDPVPLPPSGPPVVVGGNMVQPPPPPPKVGFFRRLFTRK